MSVSAASSIELELDRIRESSTRGRHVEALAAAEALEGQAPEHRDVLYLIAANQRCLDRVPDALATLQRLERRHPRFSLLYQERGHCYVHLRNASSAIAAFLRGVTLNSALAASWTMLERLYRLTGDIRNAEAAARQVATLNGLPSEVVRAGSRCADGDLPVAQRILDEYLRGGGDHPEALRLLARIEHQRGLFDLAEARLAGVLRTSPTCRAARLDYVRVLIDRQKYLQARDEVDVVLSDDSGNQECLSLQAAACAGLGDHQRAVALYDLLLAVSPDPANVHIARGHSLQIVGRSQEAAEAYRAAAVARPGFGDAYWSLANLKSYRFSHAEIAEMRAAEGEPDRRVAGRIALCFALGKALEDRKDYAESWRFYQRGNALKRAESWYQPESIEADTRRQREVCTAQFFAARAGTGAPDPDPIFVVGLPRSGSTLVEQILASHSQVDGTHELADIPRLAFELRGGRRDGVGSRQPNELADVPHHEFRRLGERYLADTRVYRRGRAFFIDKMPNNFQHLGLIHLMLPSAKIIDVRREPMACCVSNLKQLFARGQEFTYSAGDIARYYRMYLELMRHWNTVLPGRVLRVGFEDIVDDLELHVRRILEFCGLRFEPACLEFYRTERSIRTPSSEQVRRPIFKDGLFQWRNYQSWLGELETTLGDAVTRYRD
jgi:tetratricopeptide (TPR) repeat protein